MLKPSEIRDLTDKLNRRDKYKSTLESILNYVAREELGKSVIDVIGSHRMDCLSQITVGTITINAVCEELETRIAKLDELLKDQVDFS